MVPQDAPEHAAVVIRNGHVYFDPSRVRQLGAVRETPEGGFHIHGWHIDDGGGADALYNVSTT